MYITVPQTKPCLIHSFKRKGNLSEIQATIFSVPLGLENPFISIENKLLTRNNAWFNYSREKETPVSFKQPLYCCTVSPTGNIISHIWWWLLFTIESFIFSWKIWDLIGIFSKKLKPTFLNLTFELHIFWPYIFCKLTSRLPFLMG